MAAPSTPYFGPQNERRQTAALSVENKNVVNRGPCRLPEAAHRQHTDTTHIFPVQLLHLSPGGPGETETDGVLVPLRDRSGGHGAHQQTAV